LRCESLLRRRLFQSWARATHLHLPPSPSRYFVPFHVAHPFTLTPGPSDFKLTSQLIVKLLRDKFAHENLGKSISITCDDDGDSLDLAMAPYLPDPPEGPSVCACFVNDLHSRLPSFLYSTAILLELFASMSKQVRLWSLFRSLPTFDFFCRDRHSLDGTGSRRSSRNGRL
jgi:hypothetical protein